MAFAVPTESKWPIGKHKWFDIAGKAQLMVLIACQEDQHG
jgi:hypothetical protein